METGQHRAGDMPLGNMEGRTVKYKIKQNISLNREIKKGECDEIIKI